MRILIFGAGGMIGHKMYQVLSKEFPETYACIRRPFSDFTDFKIFSREKTIDCVDVADFSKAEEVLNNIKPNIILNCIGVTLRKKEIHDISLCLELNSFFPHRLKCWAAQNQAKLIHFSTDCVFDGSTGSYHEDSQPSAKDIYGKTKYLGEVVGPHCLTLRGSMIGRELHGKTELLEWALAQKGKSIKGFSRALYSGVTTNVMADLVKQIIKSNKLVGLYQVSSRPISKYDLLKMLNQAFDLKMQIDEDQRYESKKDLDSSKIRNEFGFICPPWETMIGNITTENSLYE